MSSVFTCSWGADYIFFFHFGKRSADQQPKSFNSRRDYNYWQLVQKVKEVGFHPWVGVGSCRNIILHLFSGLLRLHYCHVLYYKVYLMIFEGKQHQLNQPSSLQSWWHFFYQTQGWAVISGSTLQRASNILAPVLQAKQGFLLNQSGGQQHELYWGSFSQICVKRMINLDLFQVWLLKISNQQLHLFLSKIVPVTGIQKSLTTLKICNIFTQTWK